MLVSWAFVVTISFSGSSSARIRGRNVQADVTGVKFTSFLSSGSVMSIENAKLWEEANASSTPLCEDLGKEMPAEVMQGLRRPLTYEETQRSFKAARLLWNAQDTSEAQKDRPDATWVVGPSAAGKSFLIRHLQIQYPDAVVMDGDAFRDVHGGYLAAVVNGFYQQEPPCIWRDAWEVVKPYRSQWREHLWNRSVSAKRDLIIGEVCTNASNCLGKLDELVAQGYTNNVMAALIKESVSEKRGKARAGATGKRFGPTFALSMEAIAPIIEASNGWFSIVNTSADRSVKELSKCAKECICNLSVVREGNMENYTPWPIGAHDMDIFRGIQKTVDNFVTEIEAFDSGPHLPNCEDLGRGMHSLADQLAQNFTTEELETARALSQIDVAANKRAPLALWILGDAAVGKSSAIGNSLIPAKFGIPELSIGSEEKKWDAVLIDGAFYRDVHAGFKAIVEESLSHSPPCVWKRGWSGNAKRASKEEKTAIFNAAVKSRKNLIIPTTCADGFESCLNKVQVLKEAGYVNHIVALTAKQSVIASRGASRSDFSGRAYQSFFRQATRAFVPMIAGINGRWELWDNTGLPVQLTGGAGGDGSLDCAKEGAEAFPFLPPNPKLIAACEEYTAREIIDTGKTIFERQRKIEDRPLLKSHLPLCEELGITVPVESASYLNRPTTSTELERADQLAGVHVARRKERPIALWLMGPSAVGKSTASKTLMEDYGIPSILDNTTGRMRPDAVQIDGEIFREVHEGFAQVVQYGLKHSPPCIFKSAWKGTQARTESKIYKKEVFQRALARRNNVIIPSPCASDLHGCLSRMEELKAAGYTNHVIAIYARENLVEERGRSRADRDGKMFVSVMYDSIYAFAPMIAAANGNWVLVDNTGRAQQGPSGKGLSLKMLSSTSQNDMLALEKDIGSMIKPMFDQGRRSRAELAASLHD